MVACANIELIALITGIGKANSTWFILVQFEALSVPITHAITAGVDYFASQSFHGRVTKSDIQVFCEEAD